MRTSSKKQTEQFRPIPGSQGIYSVSNLGRVKSHARQTQCGSWVEDRILKQELRKGYPCVELRVAGRTRRFKVAYLVLRTFLGRRPAGHEVSHLNAVRTDSRLQSLAWETQAQNNARRSTHGTVASVLTERQVRAIRASDKLHRELAAEYGVSLGTISNVRRRRTWKDVA